MSFETSMLFACTVLYMLVHCNQEFLQELASIQVKEHIVKMEIMKVLKPLTTTVPIRYLFHSVPSV